MPKSRTEATGATTSEPTANSGVEWEPINMLDKCSQPVRHQRCIDAAIIAWAADTTWVVETAAADV